MIAWRWKGHRYEIETLLGVVARVWEDGRKMHLLDFAVVAEQHKALMLLCQLQLTELVAAKVFGFLAG